MEGDARRLSGSGPMLLGWGDHGWTPERHREKGTSAGVKEAVMLLLLSCRFAGGQGGGTRPHECMTPDLWIQVLSFCSIHWYDSSGPSVGVRSHSCKP
jgi:hypothetical protein